MACLQFIGQGVVTWNANSGLQVHVPLIMKPVQAAGLNVVHLIIYCRVSHLFLDTITQSCCFNDYSVALLQISYCIGFSHTQVIAAVVT